MIWTWCRVCWVRTIHVKTEDGIKCECCENEESPQAEGILFKLV